MKFFNKKDTDDEEYIFDEEIDLAFRIKFFFIRMYSFFRDIFFPHRNDYGEISPAMRELMEELDREEDDEEFSIII